VDGSEVDDANSTLGASILIVTAAEGCGRVEWEDVRCPASPAESSPLLRYGARLSTVAQNFFWTAVERLGMLERDGRLKEVQMPRFVGGTLGREVWSLEDFTSLKH
jgi:hypothetical protein